MSSNPVCVVGADNHFGPRVVFSCREFDFTLLFEDVFFSTLPTALFLILIGPRLRFLYKSPVKVTSYNLAVLKLVSWQRKTMNQSGSFWPSSKSFLTILFILQVVFTAFRSIVSSLHTASSTTSDVLAIVATFAATVLSFLEDQRSFKPSDTLVIYFSFLTVLQIPRLRSLWLMSSVGVCQGLWTAIFAVTVSLLLLESISKTSFLRPGYLTLSSEEVCGFWHRSFFAWVLPLFRTAFSTAITIDDLPDVGHDLRGQTASKELNKAWIDSKGSWRLIKALFRAYRWSILRAFVPRIALVAFTLCQPFLIATTVNWIGSEITEETKRYGQSLVGAYIIVYFGMAVSKFDALH